LKLRIFVPPFGPTNLVGRTGGFHDDPLFSGAEFPSEASQGGLNEPWLESHPCSLAVRIEFLGHTQRL
jgi:hypothetical protein